MCLGCPQYSGDFRVLEPSQAERLSTSEGDGREVGSRSCGYFCECFQRGQKNPFLLPGSFQLPQCLSFLAVKTSLAIQLRRENKMLLCNMVEFRLFPDLPLDFCTC